MIKLTCFDIWWNSNVSVLLTLCKWQISVHYKSYPNRYRKKQFLTQCCCILELRRPPTAIVVQTQTVMIRFTSKNSLFLYHWFQNLILCDWGYGSLKEVYFIFVAEKHYLQVVQREILIYSCIFIVPTMTQQENNCLLIKQLS